MQSNNPRSVVVTGAAGGMGRATCLHLAGLGWQIVAIDRNADRLNEMVQTSAAIVPLVTDLAAPDLVGRVRAVLASGLHPAAGLVNMAGISVGNTIDRLEDDDWETSFAVNVTPAMQLIRLMAPILREQGGGSIVNVGSPVGIVGARKPSYSASKAALQGLTVSCARNLGEHNIRVNLLLPGPTITGMTHDWDDERRALIAKGSFLKRLCTPEEVARTVAFLVGPDSSYMTGSVVDMTAGSMWGH